MKKDIENILDTAWTVCRDAVDHVAAANYAEREVEAYEWVNEAFDRALRELYQLLGIKESK